MKQPTFFVGIGASAGGLEAIEEFFSAIPQDTGATFIVVQHLSPDYKSLMVELLSKRTRMEVLRAKDGLKVEPDKVYLIPPKKNLTIFHGKLILTDQTHGHGLNLPIDIFFKSLAEDQGEKTIGIILSGTGSDGMRGIKEIKEAGGLLMVQDEESAKFDGMPKSAISTGLVDFILTPSEMAEKLCLYASHSGKLPISTIDKKALSQESITRIFSILRNRTGVDFTFYKPSTIIRRIERRLQINQIESLTEYYRFLENYPLELSQLYRELLIGVTSFFRDPEAYKIIQEKVLPQLFENTVDNRLRVWIAGCSTGEEAYSLAILIREQMELTGNHLDVKIFATDIDKDAILKAGNGVFPKSSISEIGQERVRKFFQVHKDNIQIVRHIREMVVFAQHNLVKDPPFTNLDLISCRNLLIYLQPVLQKKALAQFHFSLRPEGGGFLFLGSSETPGEYAEKFSAIDRKWKIFQTVGQRKINYQRDLSVSLSLPRAYSAPSYKPHKNFGRSPMEDKALDRMMQVLADEVFPLMILVNEEGEMVYILGETEGLLNFPVGRMNSDITKLIIKDLNIPLSTGLQRVFKKQQNVLYNNIKVPDYLDGQPFDILLRPTPAKRNQEKFCVLLIRRTLQESPKKKGKTSQSYDVAKETAQRISDLEQELQFSKENLQATIEELETSNEELQATNEELLSANEELQSTNEELQSVNEELFTVNSEYQQKILELTELNNDMDNLLQSIDVGTIFLDENLEIRKFTPKVDRVINILRQDIGRPFYHLTHQLPGINLLEIIERVQSTSLTEEVEFFNRDSVWYLLRVQPYKISPRVSSGILITFIDIDSVKSAQEDLAREQSLLKITGEISHIGSWELDLASGLTRWTQEVYNIYGIRPEEKPTTVEGQMSFYPPESQEELIEAMTRAQEKGTPFDLNLKFNAKNRKNTWVRISGRPLRENDEITKIQGTFADVTIEIEEKQRFKNLCSLFDSFMKWSLNSVATKDFIKACRDGAGLFVKSGLFEGCWIGIFDQKSDCLEVKAGAGLFKNVSRFKNLRFNSKNKAITGLKTLKSATENTNINASLNKGKLDLLPRDHHNLVIPVELDRAISGLIIISKKTRFYETELAALNKMGSNLAAGLKLVRLRG